MRARRTDRRLPGWERRLSAWLQAQQAQSYDWQHHCLIFAAGGVAAVTGVDLARGRKGRATTKHGALRHLKALGFETPADLISSLLPERRPGFARRADLVMGGDGIPGICLGDRAAFIGIEESEAGERHGMVIAQGPWVRAWTVGEG